MSKVEQRKMKNAELIANVLPQFTIEDLIKAGTHYGHKARSWNPAMRRFIFGTRNGIHIIDTRKTNIALQNALLAIYRLVRNGKSILMVSTKNGIRDVVKKHAVRSGQPYVDYRWLGGMMTNWKTIALSIKKIKRFEKILGETDDKGRHSVYTKKELGSMKKELARLKLYFDGIRGITARPDMVIVFDTNLDSLAVQEACKLGIPVVALVDTNSSLEGVQYPIPCNDDSINVAELLCKMISDTIITAIKDEVSKYSDNANVNPEVQKKQEQVKKIAVADKIKASKKEKQESK